MANKLLSIIIIPHSKGFSKRISLSTAAVRVILGVFVVLFVTFVVFLADYSSMNVIRQKNKKLMSECLVQRQALAKYKESTESLRKKVESFEIYAKKLNIMAGLKSPEALKEVGVGGGSFSYDVDSSQNSTSLRYSINNLRNINTKANGIEKNLDTLVKFFEEQAVRLSFTPSIAPTRGYISSGFSKRKDPFTGKIRMHWGIDIATQIGNPVVATADGVVLSTTNDKVGGLTVRISHNFGYQTIYCHMSKFLVKPGDKVKRGDVIGLVGKTGRAIGPHVHYEVRINNRPVNPYPYILDL
ncbi:MAG: M23 family metallopeptidase [Candidatus Aminicenantales bacterium]